MIRSGYDVLSGFEVMSILGEPTHRSSVDRCWMTTGQLYLVAGTSCIQHALAEVDKGR